jgi:hypothetical protein
MKSGNYAIVNGAEHVISSGAFNNLKAQSVAGGEGKPFAPELSGIDVAVRSDNKAQAKLVSLERARNSAVEVQLAIANKLGGKPYMSGQPLRWMYKKNGVPTDVPLSYVKRLEDTQKSITAYDDFRGTLDDDYMQSPEVKTVYSRYQFPNGENYREIMFKDLGQNISYENTPLVFNSNADSLYGKKYIELDATRKKVVDDLIKKKYSKPIHTFSPEHNFDSGTGGWLRINDRTYNGKKVAFLEEDQDVMSEVYNPEHFKKAEQFIKDTFGGRNNFNVTRIKAALKDAVDSGAEYFAWINGRQTSNRYNLATKLDEVKWNPKMLGNEFGAGVEAKQVTMNLKGKGNIVINVLADGKISGGSTTGAASLPSNWVGKKLDEVVGKGLADQIMGSKDGNLSGKSLEFGGEWAFTKYDKQVGNIVKDLTGAEVVKLDLGLPIKEKETIAYVALPSPDKYGGKPIVNMDDAVKLTPETIKVGTEVHIGSKGEMPWDTHIVTADLGNGQFKAVAKSVYDEPAFQMMTKESQDKRLALAEETFDISNKPAQQEAIRITPEIKAIVNGEPLPLKQPSTDIPEALLPKPAMPKKKVVTAPETAPIPVERFDSPNRKGEGVFFSPQGKGSTDFGTKKTERFIVPKKTYTTSDQETAIMDIFGPEKGNEIMEKFDDLTVSQRTGFEAFAFLDETIKKELQKQGYDSVHYLNDRGMVGIDQLSGENWGVFDTSIIKTADQLKQTTPSNTPLEAPTIAQVASKEASATPASVKLERYDFELPGFSKQAKHSFYSPAGEGKPELYGTKKSEITIQPRKTYVAVDQEATVKDIFSKEKSKQLLEEYRDGIEDGEGYQILDDAIEAELKKQGYDSIHYTKEGRNSETGKEWVVLDERIIQKDSPASKSALPTEAKRTFSERLKEGRDLQYSQKLYIDAGELSYKDFVKKYEAYRLDEGGAGDGSMTAHAVVTKDQLFPTEHDSWKEMGIATPSEEFKKTSKMRAPEKEKAMSELQRYYDKDFNPPLVKEINNNYYVIDGHHRVWNLLFDGAGDIPIYYDRDTLKKIWQNANGKKVSNEEMNVVYKELFPPEDFVPKKSALPIKKK